MARIEVTFGSAPFRSRLGLLLATTALSTAFGSTAGAQGLPTGANVAYGSVGFQRSSGTLTINQSSQTAIVNYQSFSIGQKNTVNINQPNASSAILNRVTGSTPSTIAGRLNANGQVYLINPNGIAITKTGVVKVGGGFVASTLGMSDEEFRGARKRFTGKGSSARVTNAGTVTIGRGGYAALIGGEVRNSGLISVPMGKVGLGSGETATLDVSGDGFLQVAVPTAGRHKGALISNSGRIAAEGGMVVLDAATARAAARNAVNISGSIDAHSISGHTGSILIGGGEGGRVAISGKLSVASRKGTGGTVTVTGRTIALKGATIDASGKRGGGTVKIGGDLHGSGTLAHAGTVTIDAASVIKADATGVGNGGSVVVWSDETTSFAGLIAAKGGAQGGDGGNVEVSSHGVLDYTGLTRLTAAKGASGTLLLDPYNVVISSGSNANGGFDSASPTSTYTATNTSVINATTLDTQLANGNVTITTAGAGTDAGNITVASPFGWSTGNLLTLTAANAIAVNANIAIDGGGKLALNTGTVAVGSSTQPLLSFGNGASVTYATGQSGQALSINGTAYTLEYSLAPLATDIAAASSNGGSYALATNVDGSNGGVGYGGAVVPTLSGTLEGLGHTVSNLTITGSSSYVGLIGQLNSGGTVRDIGIVGGSVSGGIYVGGLVGENDGTITQAYATGAVSGFQNVGGLVGYNNIGTITQAYATGAVSGSQYVGGLVGDNDQGAITQAYATGAVSGSQQVGGLVGENVQGAITQAYATGAVSGSLQVGGLVGSFDQGTITQAYATGAVSGSTAVGGLVGGSGQGTITQAYATGAVSGSNRVGGLVGGNTGSTITQSYWDTQTSGQTGSSNGVTGLTTRQLQGLDPISGSLATNNAVYVSTAINSGTSVFSGGTGGLYPYLTNFFPNGVQAVSGVVYGDTGTTPLASGAAGAVPVTVSGANLALGTATTGANGYYYVFGQPGTIAQGASLLAYTTANNATGAANAARIAASTYAAGTPILTGVDIWKPVTLLAAVTNATTLSASGYAPNSTPALPAGSALPSFLVGAIPTLAATNAQGFTIDGTTPLNLTTAFAVQTTASGAPLTVAQPITIANGGSLGLSAAGALAIDANITDAGTGAVSLAYDRTTATPSVTDLAFAQGASLSFTGTNSTTGAPLGALAINGTAYTLLNALTTSTAPTGNGPDNGINDVAGIDNNSAAGGDTGNYALATNLIGSGTAAAPQFGGALFGANSNSFRGTFEGLGHTITNLTIGSSQSFAGLIGSSNGTVRDIGLVGGSVSGGSGTGGLVGRNVGGTIAEAYATDTVSGQLDVGGLVGANTGTITQAYATGAVDGSVNVGGLVGTNVNGATITRAFATGAVSGSANVGGLVGNNDGSGGASKITQAYATGTVSGPATLGGLVGINQYGGTVTGGYYDASTTGQGLGVQGDGSVGLTTAALQGTAPLPSGTITDASHLGTAFGGGTGGLYPYLTSFFPGGVQAISGLAFKDAGATLLTSPSSPVTPRPGLVTVAANGTSLGTVTTGANGYYYAFVPAGTLPAGSVALASTAAEPAATIVNGRVGSGAVNAASFATVASSGATPNTTLVSGLNIYGGFATEQTAATSASQAAYATTLSTGVGGNATLSALTTGLGQGYLATGASFTLDQAVASPAGSFLATTTGGALTVAQPVTVTNAPLALLSGGSLAIDAPVTAQGAVPVTLAASIATVGGTTQPNLSFAQGASLSFTDASGQATTSPVTGQSLSINGAGYTLIRSMADIAGLNGTNGNDALATNLTSGTTYTAAVAGRFSGTLEGLGHTIANLTIADTASSQTIIYNGETVGLIGTLNSGATVRDIGLLGGSVSGTGNNATVGDLVGLNLGTITNAYSTGTVSGGAVASVGGLAGENSSSGSTAIITNAYATGAVSGGAVANVGGLAGENYAAGGTAIITDAYATGAVRGGSTAQVGGLVGNNDAEPNGTVSITTAYATGAVSGGFNASVGGIVGADTNNFGISVTISNAYFDVSTTGQTNAVGANGGGAVSAIGGFSTAGFQGTAALPGGGSLADSRHLGSTFAGGTGGLYPYLTSFFPNGVQAVSGLAYKDAGAALLTSPSGTTTAATTRPGLVSVAVDGTSLGTVTTGADGYYYAFVAAGTLPAGSVALASTAADPAATVVNGLGGSGAVNAASFANVAGSGATPNTTLVSGLNIYGGFTTEQTAAASLSAAQASYGTTLAMGVGGNATLSALTTGLGQGYLATGASFTVDQAVTSPAGGFLAATTGGALTVAQPVTITGAPLALLSAGSLAIDAPVTAQGAVSVTLAYEQNTTTPSITDLSFGLTGGGFTGSLTYTDASGNPLAVAPMSGAGSLTINSTPYDLEYSLASLASDVSRNYNVGDNYALATNVDGSNVGAGYTRAVVPTLNSTLEGLGHTVDNLTINGAGNNFIGLIGTLGNPVHDLGVVRDLGVVGGSVSGGQDVGDLVATNAGTIVQSYATGAVSGGSGSQGLGGLVGLNNNGAITQAYATGAVSGGSGSQDAGGLVGYTTGQITLAYATGAVSGGSGSQGLGGLVGYQSRGSISEAYATGAVSGGSSSRYSGGLVGENNNGAITQAYATGAVSGASSVGGLVGFNYGSISSSAFDVDTSGQTAGLGGDLSNQSGNVAGLTTAAMQSTATTGVTLGAAFSGGAAGGQTGVYPYLASFFPKGVQAVSGFAYKDAGATLLTSPASSTIAATSRAGLVMVAANGTSLGTVTTGANGYYYAFVPAGTLPAGTRVAAVTVADPAGAVVNGLGGSGAQAAGTFVTASGAANQASTNVYGGWQYESTPTGVTTLSALNAADIAAAGAALPTNIANREIIAGGGFAIDTAATLSETLALDVSGALTQSAPISAGGLLFTGSSATLTGANAIGTVAGNVTGGINLATSGATTVGALTDATGAPTSGLAGGTSVTLVSGGNQTLAATVTAPRVLLAANGTLINNAGANAVSATNGFTIYTQNPSNPTGALPGDNFGGLTGTDYYNDAYSFANGSFFSAVPVGNHFVYAYAASLTPTLSGSASKTYDATASAPTANLAVTPSGFADANGGTDTATLTFTGATYDTADAGTSKTVTASGVAFASNPNNYTLAPTPAAAAVGTISPAMLTYLANAATRTYGAANPALSGTVTGFVAGQTQQSATTGTLTFATAAGASSNAGTYAITGSGLSATDYTFAQDASNGTALSVTPAPLTVSGAKVYDTTTAFATGQLTVAGAQNGETVTLTQGTGASSSADVGGYAGSPLANLAIGVTGGNAIASNYALPGTGTLAISPATIDAAGATGVDKTYDGTTALPSVATGFTTSGIYAGDAVSVTASSAAYAGPNAGSEAVDVAGLTLSGKAAGNYVLSGTSVTGSGTISPAPVTVTTNGGTSIYGVSPSNPGLSASGLVAGQGVVVLSGLANDFALDGQSPAGGYVLGVRGTNTNGNYQVVGTTGGTFTIAPRPLVLLAGDESRLLGAANPPLAYQIGGLGLVNGDVLTGSLATSATAASPTGRYPIVQGSLAATSNYTITYVPGTLAVEPTAASSAAGLASTALRDDAETYDAVAAILPIIVSVEQTAASNLAASLSNPRFDKSIVCFHGTGLCAVVPPPAFAPTVVIGARTSPP